MNITNTLINISIKFGWMSDRFGVSWQLTLEDSLMDFDSQIR